MISFILTSFIYSNSFNFLYLNLLFGGDAYILFVQINDLFKLTVFVMFNDLHTQTSKHANIVMTSVKPIFENNGKDNKNKVGGDYVVDSSTLTRAFRYSIPYTQGIV